MKAALLFAGSGPLVVLTSHASFTDPTQLEKLGAKGIDKFIAYEIPLDLAEPMATTSRSCFAICTKPMICASSTSTVTRLRPVPFIRAWQAHPCENGRAGHAG